MHCDKVHQELTRVLDGENSTSLPLLWLHLAHCSECRQYQRSLSQLNQAARKMASFAVPMALRSRILENLPAVPSAIEEMVPYKSTFRRRLVSGLAIASILGVAVLTAPRFLVTPTNAATIRDAVQNTRTWHYSGWRIKDGKQVPWEIWGRRSPFLYREQIGDDLVVDDGRTHIQIIAPNRSAYRMKGYFLKTPSQPLPGRINTSESNGSEMTPFVGNMNGDFLSRFSEQERSRYQVTFKTGVNQYGSDLLEEGVLTVNTATRLPVSYELHRTQLHPLNEEQERTMNWNAVPATLIQRKWTQAMLKADYDVPLPENVTEIVPPKDYVVVDTTEAPAPAVLPHTNSVTRNGLTVQLIPEAMDKQGNIRFLVQAWMGNKKMDRTIQDIDLRVQMDAEEAPFRPEFVYSKDDQGRLYLPVGQPEQAGYWVNEPRLHLVPLKPIPAGEHLPQTMTLELNVDCIISDPLGNGQSRALPVVKEKMAITVQLPKQTTNLGYDTAAHSEGLILSSPPATLWLKTAQARYWYYQGKGQPEGGKIMGGKYVPNPVNKEDIRTAIRWLREGLHESRRIQATRYAKEFQGNLVYYYDLLGEHGRAAAVKNGSDNP